MNKSKSRIYMLNTMAFLCFLLALALIVLLRVFRLEGFLQWYDRYIDTLASFEIWMQTYGATWISVVSILVNFALKALIPWFPIACLCVVSGVLFEWYYAILINLAGMTLLFTIKFFWGRKFGGGNAEKILEKFDAAHNFIDSSKLGSRLVLFVLRFVPCAPVNSVSCLYGTTNISYLKYIVLSVLGFTYKLFSYTIIGRNVFDPASASFVVPFIILLIFSGMVLLTLSGAFGIRSLTTKR
ncbi:MAG: TVP38/TMEM64 family protein [Clostridia bacterium]|nr:TVP38/TMEM64 family protein [Clostridia bacterium]